MVAAVRRGLSQHAGARRFKKALRTVQRWLARAGQRPLGQVDGSDRSRAPRQQARQTAPAVERRIVAWRQQLRRGALGFIGAPAIREALPVRRAKTPPPSVRTLGRILRRHGLLDGVRRVRQLAPPPGWSLPAVAARRAELDAFDVIEDLPLEAGPRLEVFTTRALWGPVCGAWVSPALTARWLCQRLEAHWRAHGLPV